MLATMSRSIPQGYRALRRGRVSIPGQHYLLTTVCHGRRPLFGDPALAHVACRIMANPRVWGEARLLAWVLMPDHWHGLVALDREPLADVMRRVKSTASRRLLGLRPDLGRVWQPGYHDRALRTWESTRAAARYLVANPLRAGLVARIGDYPWWDAVWLNGEDTAFT
jgi:putative transposase